MVANPPRPSLNPTEAAAEIRVQGTVQGVGFRPLVYQLAHTWKLRGEVYNDAAGVVIRIAGDPERMQQFVAQLQPSAPPLARITTIACTPIAIASVSQSTFEITPSRAGLSRTQIAPDAATCPQCLADLFNPASRYYHYPFTNCTHCGPRLSIIRTLPYDRATTSMAPFPMCPDCQRAYDAPHDRRFHAQPVACDRCGPQVWLERADGLPLPPALAALDAITAASRLIQQGEIVAIKGLGGIHLACDATNERAVQQLRQRKHRDHKPFALMVRDLAAIAPVCEVSAAERALLASPAAPIVLLKRRGERGSCQLPAASLPPAVAPHLPTLGVMLPYTPLHHLLLAPLECPIVLTSGNLSDEPQCLTNEEAREKLGAIAPYCLLHNRDIVNRVDDSVVRIVAGQRQTLRRARGYAPAPIPLPAGFEAAPPILALGAELKSTFCLSRSGAAILSQHLGDLEHAIAFNAYQTTLERYLDLFEHQPVALAVDLHPDYLSTKLGEELAQQWQVPIDGIQHHHAHIAACLAEHGIPLNTSPVLGIALDGLGYGADGTLWGGEFLVADYRTFQRVAHLEPIALLGGAQAARQPWRNTYAQLMAALGWETLTDQFGDLALVQFLAHQPRTSLDQMLATGLRSPLASSAGRLFDAVAAALGCCRETVSYEGQGAIALEALVSPNAPCPDPYPFAMYEAEQCWVLSAASLWPQLLRDLQQGRERSLLASRFHYGFAQGVARLAVQLAAQHQLQQVVLSGGVFQNQVLLTAVQNHLQQAGLTVLTPQMVPPNDGGIALGQVAIAAARRLSPLSADSAVPNF